MKNIFLFYGEEDFLIDDAILEVEKKHSCGQVVKYDLTETNISILLEDASMISLFDDTKIIIGYNADFLTGNTKKTTVEHNIDSLSNYIDNPNPNTIIILVTTSDKLDKRKTIVKKLLSKVEVKEFNKLKENDKVNVAKDFFDKKGYQISYKALNMLVDLAGNNLYLLNSECEKLTMYKIDDKKINEEDIEEMIVKYDFDNIFALTDAVIKRDINTSLYLYQELLKRNEEPIMIIFLLANQFRLIFQVKKLFSKGFSEYQIATELGVHIYRVQLANMVRIDDKELLNYIDMLADLDEEIKMGKTNKEVGLELFLLKL